jgi:hypothetical protein
MVSDQTIKLALQIAGQEKADQLAKSLEKIEDAGEQAARGVHKLDDATTKAGKATTNFGHTAMQTGRVVQDFAQGGLGGALNNIEGFTLAVGLGPGAAGALTLLGVAAYAAGPAVKSFVASVMDGSNEVPPLANAVDQLAATLKKNGDQLDELRKKQTLTNTEAVKYATLTTNQIALESQLERAREAAALKKKVDALRDPAATEAAKARADSLQGEFGGQVDALKQAARGAALADNPAVAEADARYRTALEAERTAIANRVMFTDRDRANFGREAEKLRKAAQDARKKITDAADAVVDRAVGEGDAAALDVLVGAAGRRPDLFNAGQRQGLARGVAAPGRAADDAERTAEGQRIEKLSKERVEFAQEEEEAAKDLLDAGVRADRERAEKEQEARDKVAAKGMAEQAKAAREAQDDATQRFKANTGIDEAAVAFAAQAFAAGGDVDPRTGRRTGRDPFVALAGDVTAGARQAGLAPEEARGAGAAIAGQAFSQVGEIIEANRQGLAASGRGLDATTINQQAIAATLLAVQQANGRIEQVEARARELLGLAQDQVRIGRPNRGTNLRRGR